MYVKRGQKLNGSLRMDHSQNIYGLFVVYRYVCVDVIITNSTIVIFYPNLLRSYLVLHRLSNMYGIKYPDLLRPSKLHRLLILSLHVFFFKVIRLVLVAICYLAKFTSTNLA